MKKGFDMFLDNNEVKNRKDDTRKNILQHLFTFKIHIKFSVKYNMSKKSNINQSNFFKIGKSLKGKKKGKENKNQFII